MLNNEERKAIWMNGWNAAVDEAAIVAEGWDYELGTQAKLVDTIRQLVKLPLMAQARVKGVEIHAD